MGKPAPAPSTAKELATHLLVREIEFLTDIERDRKNKNPLTSIEARYRSNSQAWGLAVRLTNPIRWELTDLGRETIEELRKIGRYYLSDNPPISPRRMRVIRKARLAAQAEVESQAEEPRKEAA